MMSKLITIVLVSVVLLITYARAQTFGQAEIVYEWATLDLDWPSEADKEESIRNNTYVPARNLAAGIKVDRGDIYVTIPRWFWPNGHPVTLVKIVNVNNETKLRPYPSWEAQRQGNCSALQFVQSMEIDPNTHRMYVIDTGRIGNTLNLCPAKIVIYDLTTNTEVARYEMPEYVANRTTNYLNDIVLDYEDGVVRYAYITDANEGYIAVYDFKTQRGYSLDDPSMKAEDNNASIIPINGVDYSFPFPVNGIAMSSDFKYVYYSAVAAFGLYQIPTATLRKGDPTDKTGIRRVGEKISQTGGLTYGMRRLYYGALALNAVYYWDIDKDMADQKLQTDQVTMTTQLLLARDDVRMQWPDTFAFDHEGWLWYVSNGLNAFNRTVGMPDDGLPRIRIWKVFVNETGYLYQADKRTQTSNSENKGMPFMTRAETALPLSVLASLAVTWISNAVITF